MKKTNPFKAARLAELERMQAAKTAEADATINYSEAITMLRAMDDFRVMFTEWYRRFMNLQAWSSAQNNRKAYVRSIITPMMRALNFNSAQIDTAIEMCELMNRDNQKNTLTQDIEAA